MSHQRASASSHSYSVRCNCTAYSKEAHCVVTAVTKRREAESRRWFFFFFFLSVHLCGVTWKFTTWPTAGEIYEWVYVLGCVCSRRVCVCVCAQYKSCTLVEMLKYGLCAQLFLHVLVYLVARLVSVVLSCSPFDELSVETPSDFILVCHRLFICLCTGYKRPTQQLCQRYSGGKKWLLFVCLFVLHCLTLTCNSSSWLWTCAIFLIHHKRIESHCG